MSKIGDNKMSEDLQITEARDQAIMFDPDPFLREVDRFYEQALNSSNPPMTLLNKVKELSVQMSITGLALAKLLYRMRQDWDSFGIEEPFTDTVFVYVGKSPTTVDRYIQVWRMYAENNIPPAYKKAIQVLPMRSQVPIALTLRQGHELTDEDWAKLVNAPDNVSIREALREIKRQPMRRSGITFVLHRNGDLTATDSVGITHFIGYLNLKEYGTDEIVQRCIDRIVDNAYILRE